MSEPFSGDDKAFNLLVFGDSIVLGAWDAEGGWVDRVKRKVHEKSMASELAYCGRVINLGVDGDTSEGLRTRFEPELQHRRALFDESDELIIAISIGVNDSIEVLDTGEHLVTLERYRENLEALFETAKKYTDKILFIGMQPVDENKTVPIPWEQNYAYRQNHIEEYDAAAREICRAKNLDYLPLQAIFSQHELDKVLYDGVHPNTRGHELIAQKVIDWLSSREWI